MGLIRIARPQDIDECFAERYLVPLFTTGFGLWDEVMMYFREYTLNDGVVLREHVYMEITKEWGSRWRRYILPSVTSHLMH